MKCYVVLIVLLLVMFSSCIIEKDTTETYVMKNESSAIIKVVPYKTGLADSSSIIELDKGGENTFEINTYRGKNNGPQYIVTYFAQVDSLLVIWDGAYKVLHIPDSTIYQGTLKVIDTTSDRNLGSVRKYHLQKEEKRYNNTFILTYSFTEQDYLDAKE